MKIVLDTGCIDLFLNNRVSELSDFQKQIQEHELSGDDICVTIINYAERMAGIKQWMSEIKFPKKEQNNSAKKNRDYKIAKIKQIEDFFKILKENGNILNISNKTAHFYSDLHSKLSLANNNISKGELKNMHNDLWVTSLCLENSCKLYTCNNKDFEKIGNIDDSLNFEVIPKN